MNTKPPKTESEIDALIRQQLAQNGFNDRGIHESALKQPESPKSEVLDESTAVEEEIDASLAQLRPKREKVIDDRFIRLEELPSEFLPYPDRQFIMVRPFSVKELKLIARSIETGNVDYITQAIDNCIDIDVYELTIPDYYYLYYWFRIESYPNTPHYMEWVCDETVKDKVCGYENTSQLTQASIKLVHLKTDLGFTGITDTRLDYPRVSLLEDLNTANADRKALTKKEQPEQFSLDDLVLVDAAKWIKEGRTIFDKLKILDQQRDLSLYESASAANKALQYGVYEFTTVTCRGCGAKRRYRVLLDAPKFFPFLE
jgi:hypothetical protein